MDDKRKLLKNGIFGIMDTGDRFVIVDDEFVYESGEYDLTSYCDKDLNLKYRSVEKLVIARSFKSLISHLDEERFIIYDRKREETCLTIKEIEEKLGVKNLKIVKEK